MRPPSCRSPGGWCALPRGGRIKEVLRLSLVECRVGRARIVGAHVFSFTRHSTIDTQGTRTALKIFLIIASVVTAWASASYVRISRWRSTGGDNRCNY